MKTYKLLVVACVIAVGVVSPQAQGIYTSNLVTYVNQLVGPNFSQQPTPLDVVGGNSLTNVFKNPYNAAYEGGPLDGDQAFIWNGHGFDIYTFDSALITGLGDAQDIDGIPQPVPTVNPGVLFYFFNGGFTFTNTVVGTVHVDFPPTGTNVVGTTTNIIPGNLQFLASKLPIGGGISSGLGLTNPSPGGPGNGVLDGDQVYVPIIATDGQFKGYTIYTFDSTLSTGFGDAQDVDGIAKPEPVISFGNGFLLFNAGTTLVWTQSQ
jgi:hypothetical protein